MFVDVEIKTDSCKGLELKIPAANTAVISSAQVSRSLVCRITKISQDGICFGIPLCSLSMVKTNTPYEIGREEPFGLGSKGSSLSS